MDLLQLGKQYNREQIHGFFGGGSKFTRSAGTWGIQGMLRTADDSLSWVFFVTQGHKEGDHLFEEGITDDGVLSWQSQPKLSLDSPQIIDLIEFDHEKHNIFLFFRRKKNQDYHYLGRLAYLTHDVSREKPVYFEWQLLNWDSVRDLVSSSFSVNASEDPNLFSRVEKVINGSGLRKGENPKKSSSKRQYNRKFSGILNLDPSRQKTIGDIGEELVFEYEKQRLINLGFTELANKIEHSSKMIGDGLGYDIKSFNEDGSHRYIEVKTTTQSNQASFYMSVNEVEFARINKNAFFIYRVYKLNEKLRSGLIYEISGQNLLNDNEYAFEPTQFKINLSS